jgi:hypothetical protein
MLEIKRVNGMFDNLRKSNQILDSDLEIRMEQIKEVNSI